MPHLICSESLTNSPQTGIILSCLKGRVYCQPHKTWGITSELGVLFLSAFLEIHRFFEHSGKNTLNWWQMVYYFIFFGPLYTHIYKSGVLTG